jgi:hypothetical protein
MNGHADFLATRTRIELSNLPIEFWEWFFPADIAVWRFIEAKRPGVFGDIKASLAADGEPPTWEGKGAARFRGTLAEDPRYIDLVEAIMMDVVDALRDELPGKGLDSPRPHPEDRQREGRATRAPRPAGSRRGSASGRASIGNQHLWSREIDGRLR